jgi:hypothetical protein
MVKQFEFCLSLLWIECDSKLATLAFKSSSIIPWHLKNRWENCMQPFSMNVLVTPIYRERNLCADNIASLGLGMKVAIGERLFRLSS